MKPCSKNRKLIAWLVLGDLEDARAIALRGHLETCEDCRHYLTELARLTNTMKATEPVSDVEATVSFHQRVVARVKTQERMPAMEILVEFLRRNLLNWRVAMSAVSGLALILAMWMIFSPVPSTHSPAFPNAPSNIATKFDGNFQPTVANYQMVANQSLEKLDRLLNDQGKRRLPSVKVYTAWMSPLPGNID